MPLPRQVSHRRCARQAMPLALDRAFVLNASQSFVSNVFSEFGLIPTVIVPVFLLIPMAPIMLKFSVMDALMFRADMARIFGGYAQDRARNGRAVQIIPATVIGRRAKPVAVVVPIPLSAQKIKSG